LQVFGGRALERTLCSRATASLWPHPPRVCAHPQAVDEFAELMVSTHEETCPWRVSAPPGNRADHLSTTHSFTARLCENQTHVFGDASIRLKDARTGGEDDAPRGRRVDPSAAVSLDEQMEARRVGRMYVPEVDHDGF
jgi:hypothetical protein